MKKAIAILLLVAMAAVMLTAASAYSAEPDTEIDYKEFSSVTLCAASNVISLSSSRTNIERFVDMNGNMIYEFDHSVFVSDYGTCLVVKNMETKLSGLLALDGRLVLEEQYDAVEVKGSWAAGIRYTDAVSEDDYDTKLYRDGAMTPVIISSAELCNFVSGEVFAVLTRDEFRKWDAYGDYINIVDSEGNIHSYNGEFSELEASASNYHSFSTVRNECTAVQNRETGLVSLNNADGDMLTPAKYGYITVYTGDEYFVCESKEGEVGLLDSFGNELIPTSYDSILQIEYANKSEVYSDGSMSAAVKGSTVSIFNRNTGVRADIDCSGASSVEFTGSGLLVSYDGALKYFTSAGAELTFPEGLSDIECRVLSSGVFFTASDANGNEVVLDGAMNVICVSEDLIGISDDGHVCIMDRSSRLVKVYSPEA